MKNQILSVRITRRAVGAAILTADGLTLADGRHLSSRMGKAAPAATRYIERVLKASQVTAVVIDAPEQSSTVTAAVAESLRGFLAANGLPPIIVVKADLLPAYGQPPLRTRDELRATVVHYWPELSSIRSRIKPYAIDAAAAALYTECRLALSPRPT